MNISAETLNNLGIALQSTKLCQDAESTDLKATSIDPDFAEPFKNLGRLLWETDSEKEAAVMCQKGAKLENSYQARIS